MECRYGALSRMEISLTFFDFLMVTRETPGTGFMPSFCIAFRDFFSLRLCFPRSVPSSAGPTAQHAVQQLQDASSDRRFFVIAPCICCIMHAWCCSAAARRSRRAAAPPLVPVVSAISWPTCFWEVRPLLVVADVRVLVLLDLLQLSATRSVTHMELQTSHLVDAKWIASRTHRDSAAFTPLCSIMQAASVSTFCISARQCVASGCLALADGCHELASMAGGTRSTAA